MDRSVIIRIISLTLAGADFLQTIPQTYKLYKKNWRHGGFSPICAFYAGARYFSIVSLITNVGAAFATTFTQELCNKVYMFPNVTALLAAICVQCLLFIRTCSISQRSKPVFWLLGGLLVLLIPVETFGIVYHRRPVVKKGSCKGVVTVPGDPDWNIVFYIACLCYDIITCVTATGFLISASNVGGKFRASKFVRQILRNGIVYTVIVSIANLLVVCEFTGATNTGVGSALPLALVMICAVHLILSTQDYRSDHYSHSEEQTSRPLAFPHLKPSAQSDLELQSSDYGGTTDLSKFQETPSSTAIQTTVGSGPDESIGSVALPKLTRTP